MIPRTKPWLQHGGAPSDPLGVGLLTAQDFKWVDTDPFVEGYDMSLPSDAADPHDTPLFAGMHESRRLTCGPKIEVSAVTSVCNGRHTGILKRSLTLVLLIDGAPLDLAIGAGSGITVERGQALLITMRDAETFFCIHRKGDRSRSLLLQTRPEDIVDPELAKLVEKATVATSITRLPAASWSSAMPVSVSGPDPIRWLVEESCALGLLAQALRTVTGGQGVATATINPGDRRKMLRVRDLLIAAPDKKHRLADLAREAGVSVTTLTTKFAAVFGQPVFACLRDIRLDHARAGIEQDGWTVSQAAYAVGYQHLGSFSEAFRRKFGKLPSDLRRRA